jgi:peptide/nickel transport system permease protein
VTTAQGRAVDRSRDTRDNLRRNPRYAVAWVAVAAVLVVLELGAILEFGGSMTLDVVRAVNGISVVPVTIGTETLAGFEQAAAEVPRLLSRQTIPNHGVYSTESEQWVAGPVYYDGQEWVGTFLGLEPAHAWLLRVAVVYAYAFAGLVWIWTGYKWYRRHYRVADWTPRDDVVDRLRSHYWGLFGLLVVLLFMTTVLFGPTLAPATNQANNVDPYSYQIQYWNADAGAVETAFVGEANSNSGSTGSTNVGLWSYDDYGRFHPAGTIPTGQDLFTFIMYGARLSLIIGLTAVGFSTLIAATLAMVSAYYKGRVDLGLVLLSDSIMALPALLVIIMLSVLFGGTWLANVYDGGLLLAVIFVATGWPALWRAIRGPTFQTTEREWVDAARGFGLRPLTIMRKHVLPYVTGYLLVYGSMNLGGVIIGIAGLSYLGLGVNPPTPEWGRAVGMGQPYIGTPSWHISIVPGVLITIVVIGFNALGDGVRDAIDPQSDTDTADTGGVERGGGA